MSNDFSDAPLKVNGITVKPAGPWSKQHRADVAEDMGKLQTSHLPPGEREYRYVKWYAAQHGLTFAEARQRVKEMLL